MTEEERINLFSLVARPAVNKQSNFVESFDDLLAVLDELLLPFPLEKSVNQRSLCSRSEHVRVLPLEVYGSRGTAPFASPASRDVWEESERGFILAAHNKTFLAVVPCDKPRFFLNASCSSLLGDL